MDRPDRIDELLAANTRLVLKGRELKRQLEAAQAKFEFYAQEHIKKADVLMSAYRTGSGLGGDPLASSYLEQSKATAIKAQTNLDMAMQIRATLDGYHVIEEISNLSAS